jgi:hypothetical protein
MVENNKTTNKTTNETIMASRSVSIVFWGRNRLVYSRPVEVVDRWLGLGRDLWKKIFLINGFVNRIGFLVPEVFMTLRAVCSTFAKWIDPRFVINGITMYPCYKVGVKLKWTYVEYGYELTRRYFIPTIKVRNVTIAKSSPHTKATWNELLLVTDGVVVRRGTNNPSKLTFMTHNGSYKRGGRLVHKKQNGNRGRGLSGSNYRRSTVNKRGLKPNEVDRRAGFGKTMIADPECGLGCECFSCYECKRSDTHDLIYDGYRREDLEYMFGYPYSDYDDFSSYEDQYYYGRYNYNEYDSSDDIDYVIDN